MPGLDEFKLLAKFAPYQLYRFAMDWDEQYHSSWRAVKEWEKREPRSLDGVLNAYAYVIPLIRHRRTLNVHGIQRIHQECSIALATQYCPAGVFRTHYVVIGITQATASDDGLRALVALNKAQGYLRHCSGLPVEASADELVLALNLKLTTYPGYFCLATFNAGFTTEALDVLTDTNNLDQHSDLKIDYKNAIIQAIEKALNLFNRELVAAQDDNQQLFAIAKVVQRLEHIHPFYDCNCRVFCMVVLNTLLMQNGFSPALIDDPNKFDAYSIQELVALIQVGMQRTKTLCDFILEENKHPTHHDPDDVTDDVTDVDSWMHVHPTQRGSLSLYASKLTNLLNPLSVHGRPFFKGNQQQSNSTCRLNPSVGYGPGPKR